MYVAVSQVVAMPISVLITAMTAHYLGAVTFGYAYLASTLCSLGFLAVGWGHESVLPAVVARDRSLAGTMLASSLAWRAAASVVAYGVMAFGCYLLNYPAELQWALGLTSLLTTLTYFVATCKDTIRGLERTDIPAYIHVGQQLLAAAFVAIALVLGGELRATLFVQSVAGVIVLLVLWPTLHSTGVGTLSVRWQTIKKLFYAGVPFMVYGVAMALQPNIDAVYLSKLAPAEVMGWYGVSRRLVGTLLLPATALTSALYPTLCRLYATEPKSFTDTTRGALGTISLVVVPVALGCTLFPEIGVALFSERAFKPAEDNLRVMGILVALMYLSMPLGICILAAGRQRAWSVVQCLCVVTSLVLDPLLVPIFQSRTGNGGLGLCVASVISEVVVISCAIALTPRGVFDSKLGKLTLAAVVSGVAMAITAQLARRRGVYISASLSVAAYAAALWYTGGIDKARLKTIAGALRLTRASSAT
jgi:O-antigen/teichoic acid export membrane protein